MMEQILMRFTVLTILGTFLLDVSTQNSIASENESDTDEGRSRRSSFSSAANLSDIDGMAELTQANSYALNIQERMSKQMSVINTDELRQALLLLTIRGTNLSPQVESIAAALDAAEDETAQLTYIQRLKQQPAAAASE